MIEMPDVRLEVAFAEGASTGTLLTLDDSSRGKLNTGTLGGGLASEPVWTEISAGGLLRQCTVVRGSSRVDAPVVTYDPGTLTAVLDNSGRQFDPSWLDGPYTEESTVLSGEQVVLNSNTGFESGTGGWTGFGGTFTSATDQFHAGTHAGKIVPTGAAAFVSIDADQAAVTAGQTYQASAWIRNAAARNVYLKIDWFSSVGGSLGSVFSSPFKVTAGTWSLANYTAVAPAGAATGKAAVLMGGSDGIPPAGHILWVDEATFSHLPYKRVTQVTAMRAVRLAADWNGVTYELWRGFADQWEVTWTPGSSYSECVLTATDASKVLSGIDRTALSVPVGGGELSGARVDRILTSAGWPVGDRDVDAGDSAVQETTLDGDAWTELQTVSASELGELYVDGRGRVVFRNRRAFLSDARSAVSQGTFGDTYDTVPTEDVAIAGDDSTFYNDVRVTRAESDVEQVAEDAVSQDLYYRKTYRPPVAPIVITDADALAYAQWLLHITSEPELRFTELQVLAAAGPPDQVWPHALGREIGDRITVTRHPPGGDGSVIQRDQFIRGVRHEFTDATWTTTWVLQDATRYGSFFVLDHADLGVLDTDDALAY